VRRILLRDKEHDETFFYISIWQSLADLEAYRASPAGVAHRDALVAAGVFATTSRVECDLIHDDGPTLPAPTG
jgi:heme-degrading monooxygenase HmoA